MRRFVLLFLVGGGIVAAFSCGGASVSIPDAAPDDGGPMTDTPTPDAPPLDAPPTCRACSGDLHRVVDCQGNTIQMCSPDQACAPNGQCIAACDAARAQKSSIGCEYYAVNPGQPDLVRGDCFAAYIANTWNADLAIDVSFGGQPLTVANFARIPTGNGPSLQYMPLPNGKLPPGQVAILFLADATTALNTQSPAKCPNGLAAITTDSASKATEYIKAFKITTSLPAAAFDIFPYGGSMSYATSATMLIPVSAWGTSHVGVHGYALSQANMLDHLFLQIVSDEDNNQVTITPTSAIVGGNGVAAAAQNQPQTYTVNKGQVLQIVQDGDLSGSPITSTKPVALFGGNACFNIEVGDQACDTSHQQLPPVSAMASEYVAVRHRDRGNTPEVPPWRVVGVVDGTQLTYLPSTPNGAPTSIGSKQLVKFNASGPFVVKSQDAQHPFYFAAHMMSGNNAAANFTGDPEHVNVIPPAQWLQSYVFMADPTMKNTNVVLVRGKASDNTYKDVQLDCLGAAVSGWQTISGSDYQYTNVDLARGGSGINGCDNGRRTATSAWPFALTLWGYDSFVSYAYPGGASVRPINGIILPTNDQ